MNGPQDHHGQKWIGQICTSSRVHEWQVPYWGNHVSYGLETCSASSNYWQISFHRCQTRTWGSGLDYVLRAHQALKIEFVSGAAVVSFVNILSLCSQNIFLFFDAVTNPITYTLVFQMVTNVRITLENM